jgi:hypothetical protein
MLSTDLSTILIVFIGFVTFFACLFMFARLIRTEKYVDSCMSYVNEQNKRSLSLKKMAEVETSLTELTDSYDALLTSHKKLRSRIGMREHRAPEADREGAIPDSQRDPSGYKRAMRLKLGAGSLK